MKEQESEKGEEGEVVQTGKFMKNGLTFTLAGKIGGLIRNSVNKISDHPN